MSLPEQNNSALYKMSSRLGYAGSGELSPILEGLRGRFTFSPDYDKGEHFHAIVSADAPTREAVVQCYSENMKQVKTWVDIVDFETTDGRDIIADVTFGDENYMFSGAGPTRNIIQWTSNWGTCRRQFWTTPVPTYRGIYIDNQDATTGNVGVQNEDTGEVNSPAKVFVDPTAGINGGSGSATGETSYTMYWDKTLSFSINLLPEVGDEFFQQQEWFDPKFDAVSGNRYANTLRNWAGVKTVEVYLDVPPPLPAANLIIPEMAIEELDGYFWGPVLEGDLGHHTLYFYLRSVAGSDTTVQMTAGIIIDRFPCGS